MSEQNYPIYPSETKSVGMSEQNYPIYPSEIKLVGMEKQIYPICPSETKLEGHGKTNFPNMPIRNKISGHGKANLINIPKSQNSPKYKQKISKTTPKILKTKNKTQNHHNYAAAAFTESVKFRFKQIS